MSKTHSGFIRSQASKAKTMGIRSAAGAGAMKAPPAMAVAPMGGNRMTGGALGSAPVVGLPMSKGRPGRF